MLSKNHKSYDKNKCEEDKISQSIVDKYIENTAIQEEITYAKNIFINLKIPVINVTNKAIEESAAEIINIYIGYFLNFR